MPRHAMWFGAVALAVALVPPSVSLAYFPPTIGQPPVTPPDPFRPPDTGGLREPEAPPPKPGPSVQTPEPASILTALTGLALAGGRRLRRMAKGGGVDERPDRPDPQHPRPVRLG